MIIHIQCFLNFIVKIYFDTVSKSILINLSIYIYIYIYISYYGPQ